MNSTIIGNDNFFKETPQNLSQAIGALFEFKRARPFYLRKKMRRPFNWTCNEQWKKADENSVVYNVCRGRNLFVVNIKNIGKAVECIEGNSQW